MICIFIVFLLASTNPIVTAPFIAGLRLSTSWTAAGSIFSLSVRPTSRSEKDRIGFFPGHPHSSIRSLDNGGWGSKPLTILMTQGGVGFTDKDVTRGFVS